jgi:hypothetical protein
VLSSKPGFLIVPAGPPECASRAVLPDRHGTRGVRDFANSLGPPALAQPAGRPYLPAGTAVRFAMQIDAPPGTGTAKLTWVLNVPDGVAAGGAMPVG